MNTAIRTALNVVGQGLSSATNLVLQLVLLATLSLEEFGWVVIGLAGFHVATAIGRTGTGDVLVAHAESGRPPSMAWANRRLARLGLANLAFSLLVFELADRSVGAAVVIGASSIPLLLLDGVRYLAWSQKRPDRVIAIDAGWFATMATAIAALWLVDALDGTGVAAAWSLGGLVSLLFARIRGWHRIDRTPSDADEPTRTGRALLAAELPNLATVHATPILVGVLLGATSAATYRAVLLPFMLAETALLAVRVTSLGIISEDPESRRRLRTATMLTSGTAVTLVGLTVLGLLTPLRSLLGDVLDGNAWLLAIAAAMVVVRASVRPTVDQVALRHPVAKVGRIRVLWSSIEVAAMLAGASAGLIGVLGARLGATLGSSVVWLRLARQRPGRSTNVRTVRTTMRASSASD